jgi:hypothetical protein
MNQRYFSIFQKYQGRRFARDLDKLRKDLSARGLLNSGIGQEEIDRLTADHRDIIEMKKEEEVADTEEQKKQKSDRVFSRTINIISIFVIVIGLLFSTWTFYETKKLNRPYLSIEKKDNIFLFENNGNYSVLKTVIKNTGSLPAEFHTNLSNWPCTTTPRRSENDFISPGQEFEIGYNLHVDCKMADTSDCKTYENISLNIDYKSPGQKNYEYTTSLKPKFIRGDKDMTHPITTSSPEYTFKVIYCGGEDARKGLVGVWYIYQMK